MIIPGFLEPKDVENFLRFCGEWKGREIIATVRYHLSKASAMAELYSSSEVELERKMVELEADIKKFPLWRRILPTFRLVVREMKGDLRDEIMYRKDGHVRGEREWEAPFRELGERYRGIPDMVKYNMVGCVLDAIPSYEKVIEARRSKAA